MGQAGICIKNSIIKRKYNAPKKMKPFYISIVYNSKQFI